MELIDQHIKGIMQGCKERAAAVGLKFDSETLEYIVTNRDLLELSPKGMIPTLYDYWVHDVEVLREKGRYELYPNNPYETVINTRPAISFYNDNNPDWLNVMIFYHVLGHIDFFQNNLFFQHTWDYDFTGRALSDKRMISFLRSRKGRWVDYIIEFTRGIDNLVGYYDELSKVQKHPENSVTKKVNYYFDVFLQTLIKITPNDFMKEVENYNSYIEQYAELGIQTFFADVMKKYPEFESMYKKFRRRKSSHKLDLIQYLMKYSPFLDKPENRWMKSVMEVVRKTSLFFQPQIRTKIMNEGWASYWHETLFMQDERIKGHEVEFARVNSGVTAMPRVGLNPYALGMRLFYSIEERMNKGQFSLQFDRLKDEVGRNDFNHGSGDGKSFIFDIRKNFNDFMFINSFVDQDFIKTNNLFVSGKRMNKERMVWEYYVKSRKAEDYRNMLFDSLYHPPMIKVEESKSADVTLYLNHVFEGKPLVHDFIANTMMGLEFLWGGPIKLETSEIVPTNPSSSKTHSTQQNSEEKVILFRRVLYTMEKKKLSKKIL